MQSACYPVWAVQPTYGADHLGRSRTEAATHNQPASHASEPAGTTLRGNQDRALIAAAGGAGRRTAKNASTGMNQSREAHLAERSLHSPEGT
jgi:hypothetical protein